MTKQRKSEPKPLSERLLKKLAKEPAPTGDLVTSQNIFGPFFDICKFYLEHFGHAEAAQNRVATIAFHFREESRKRFGHSSVEVIKLAELLRKQKQAERIGRPDVLTHIRETSVLDVMEESAAKNIQYVWTAFGKGLMIGERDMSRSGGSKRAVGPMETMGEELWEDYKADYIPWARKAERIVVVHTARGQQITLASLVFSVLVEDRYPQELDSAYGLPKGRTLWVLRRALARYWEPTKLTAELFAEKKPTLAKKGATNGNEQRIDGNADR